MIGIVVPSVLKVVSGWVVPSVVGVVSISVLLLVTSGVVVSVVVRSANSSKYIIIYQARYEVTVYRIRKFLTPSVLLNFSPHCGQIYCQNHYCPSSCLKK